MGTPRDANIQKFTTNSIIVRRRKSEGEPPILLAAINRICCISYIFKRTRIYIVEVKYSSNT